SSLAINSDTLTAPSGVNVYGWTFQHNAQAGFTGDRVAGLFFFNQQGTSGNKAAGAPISAMEALEAFANASFTEGGSANTASGSYGQLFGANFHATLNSGATNFNALVGTEFNLTAATGSSVFNKTMVQIISSGGDAVKGAAGYDIMLLLGQQISSNSGSPAAYYDTGIQLGSASSSWPFGTSAAMIAEAEPQNVSISGARQAIAGYGVKFGATEFNTASWQAMGSLIDGSGNATFQGLTIGNWSLALSSGSLQISSANKQTATITLHTGSGGSGWAVGDKFTYGATGVGKVSTTNGGGVVTGVTQLVPDSEASPCTSNCATTATNNTVYRTGGSGLAIDTTAVGPGNFNLGGASALSTSATSGFLQIATVAGAPTGTVGSAGAAAVVIDTTNKKLCYSTGSAWECSAAFTP